MVMMNAWRKYEMHAFWPGDFKRKYHLSDNSKMDVGDIER
jgi:hypothetical protein